MTDGWRISSTIAAVPAIDTEAMSALTSQETLPGPMSPGSLAAPL